MKELWKQPPMNEEELQDWHLYCYIWKANGFSSPAYWIRQWVKSCKRSDLSSLAQSAITIVMYNKYNVRLD